MRHIQLLFLSILLSLCLALLGCDLREGTIVYDFEFPRADSFGDQSGPGPGETVGFNPNGSGAGYRIHESNGETSVIESGTGDSITVKLTREPSATVTIALVALDSSEVSVSPNTLSFTSSDWRTAKTVSVNAVEDGIIDGNQTSALTVVITGSSDPNYASGIPSSDLPVTTLDSGTIIKPDLPAAGAGITVTQSDGRTSVTESGTTDTITVVLNQAPSASVTVTVTSTDGEISASPATLSFTPGDWSQPQTVIIQAVEDGVIDGDLVTSFSVAVTGSTDPAYYNAGIPAATVPAATVPVSVIDSAKTPILQSANSSHSVNEGSSDSNSGFALVVPPQGTITATFTSADTGEILSPNSLTFDSTNWQTAQALTFQGVEDYVQDGDQNISINYILSSTVTTEPTHGKSGVFTVSNVDSRLRLIIVSNSSPRVNEGYYDNTTTIRMDYPPSGTVTLTLSSPDTGEVTVSTTTITFDNNTWNIPQAITFYGPEDYLLDGDQYTPVSLSFVSSDTTEAIHGISTTITVTTDDSSLGTGFILSDSTPSLREGTTDNSTNFELSSPPKGTVTVTFTSTNDNESIVSPSTLIFTPLNWNIAQPLNLVGVEDFTIDDNQTTQMNISYSSTDTTDGVHNKSDNFNVVTVDSRLTSAFSLSKTPTSTEGSSDNSSTFVLNSKPIDNVTVTFGSKNLQTTGTSAFIYHYNNYDNSFEEQKSILEELGYSVTGSATYPPAASDIAGVRIVIDFNFSQQCDTSCKNVYDDYIRDGGTLIISGEHNLNSLTQNRNASLQGLLSQLGQTVNLVTTSYQGSAYATAAFSLDDGVTYYDGATFSSSTGDTLVERLNGENIWRMWSSSDLPAGYLGRVVLTFDMDQFTRNGDLAFVAAIYRDLVGLAYYTNNEFNFTKTLTFTPDNWNVPQIVTIAGIEDFIVDDNSTTTMNAYMISNDPSYGDYTNTFTVNVIDSRIDVPFIVNPNTPTVAEGTDNSSSTLALQTKPIKNVNVTFTSHDTGEVVTSTTLTFSPDNWSTGQPLTFYGIEDFTQDNNTSTTLTALFSSVDSAISGKSDNFSVVNIDSGIMSPFILTTSVPTVIEGQDNSSIGFRLPSRPTSNVTVTFVSGDTGEIRISNVLTFTPDNYSTAQNITLTGIEDFIVDNTSTSIVTAYFSTTDLSYGGMSDNFSVQTLDSKITSTFTLIPTTPEVLEGTDNNSSTFVLTSRPKGTVTASFTSDNLSSVTLPYPTMTFTTDNWSSPQNITFTGIEDFKNIGNRSTNIQVSYSSTDNTDPIHGRTANFTVKTLDSGLTSAIEASSTPTVIEGGSDNSTTIKLTSPPKQNVSVTLSTQDLASIGKKAVIYYSVSADYSKQRSLLQELGYDVTGSASNVSAALIDGARIVIDLRYNKTCDSTCLNAYKNYIRDGGTLIITGESDSGFTSIYRNNSLETLVSNSSYLNQSITIQTADYSGPIYDNESVRFDDGESVYTSGATFSGNGVELVESSTSESTWMEWSGTNLPAGYIGKILLTFDRDQFTSTDSDDAFLLAIYKHAAGLAYYSNDEIRFPTTSLTFTPNDWNVAQVVTVRGVADFVDDNDTTTTVHVSLTSSDTVFDGQTGTFLANVTDDNLTSTYTIIGTPSATEGTIDNSTTFQLTTAPQGTVTVSFTSKDEGETVLLPATLTFGSDNWSQPQTLNIVGVEDFTDDNDTTTTMNVSYVSTDTLDGIHRQFATFTVDTIDSNISGTYTISPNSPSVMEGDDNSTTFKLNSMPIGIVTVTLTSDNTSELRVVTTTLTFSADNYSTAQPINFSGVEDFKIDDNKTTNLNIAYSSTVTAEGIHGLTDSFTVVTIDSGLTSPYQLSGGLSVSEGTSDNSTTLQLTTRPTDNVTFILPNKDLTAHIFYESTSNGINQFSAQKSILEGLGFIVTGSVTYSEITTDIVGARLVIDLKVNNSCDSTCQSSYDDYLKGGGTLIFSGENNSSSTYKYTRNPSVRSLTQKFGHTVNIEQNSYTGTIYDTDDPVLSDGQGYYSAGATFSSDGDELAKTSTNPATSKSTWMMWSGSNLKIGYNGQLLITFDANQFMSTGDGPFLSAIYSHAINQLGINDHEVGFTQNITFTPDNWNIPQPVTLIGIEDYVVDDNTTNSIGVIIKSADSVFNGLTDNFTVSVIDSTRIIPISFSAVNLSVTEGTDNSSNTVALAFRPRSNVTVSFTSQDTGEFRISDTLTFSPDNWSNGQSFTLTGMEDFIVDNDTTTTMVVDFESIDFSYSGRSDNSTLVITEDSGISAAYLLNPNDITIPEGNDNITATFALASCPTGVVTVSFNSSNEDSVTIVPDNLTFGPDNCSTPQTITFTSYENFNPANDNTSFDISYSSTDPTDPIDGLTESFGTTITDSGLTSPISASNGSDNSSTVSVSVMEGYSDNSSTFKLTAKPSSDVTYTFSLIDFTTHSNRAFIYHSGYDQTYEKQKANLESLGFIVSGANTLTVSASDISNASLVLDLRYDRSCDASCISVYDNFVKNGGRLIVAGEHEGIPGETLQTYIDAVTARNSSLIDNLTVAKFGGSVTKLTNLYEGVISNTHYDPLPSTFADGEGWYEDGFTFSGDGVEIAKSTDGETTWMVWAGGDLPGGYSGRYLLTFDVDQFGVSYGDDNFTKDILGYAVDPNNYEKRSEVAFSQSLTFTPTNWDVAQAVTVQGLQDYIQDGSRTTTVYISISSADKVYNGLSSSFTVTVADNGSKVLPPDNLTATATGEPGEVFLSWENSPTSDNVTIYWTDDTSLAIDVDNVSTYDGFTVIPAPDDNVTIQGLRSGVTYNFTAVASNDGGPGNSSPEQSATTYVAPVPKPTGLSVYPGDGSYDGFAISKTDGSSDFDFNPSYGVIFDSHPDSTNSDNYTLYWSSNLSLAIDPDNASTYANKITWQGDSKRIFNRFATDADYKSTASIENSFVDNATSYQFVVTFYDASKELESPPSDNFTPWSLPRADLQCGNWNLAYGWLKDNQTMAGGMNWIDYGGILESSQQIGIGERFIVDKDWVTPYIRNPMLNDVSEKVLFFLQNNPSDSVSGLKLKGKYNTSYQLLPGGALTQQGTNQLDTYSYAFEVLDNNTFNAMIDTHTNLQNTYSSQAGGSFQDLETSLGYASYQNLNFPIPIKWAIDGQISRNQSCDDSGLSIIPIPAPALPSIYDNVTLTSSGNGDSVIVKWSDNNSTADNFTVYWSINSAGPININNSSSYTGSVTVSSASSSTTINSLNLGDNVSIVVAGNNYSGTGTPTTESSVVTALNYTLNSPVISFVSGLNGIQIRIDNSTGGNNPWSSTHPGADGWVIYISQTDNVTINDNHSIILPPTEYSTGNHPNVITVKSSSNPADWDTTDAFSRNCESDCVWYYQHYSKGYQYIRAQVINSVTGAASTLSNELRTVQIPTGTIADNYALYVHPTATTQRYTQSMETFSASPEQWKQTSTGFVKNALVDVGEPVTLTWNLAASDDYVDNYTLYRVDQNAQILTDNQSIPFSVLSNATVIQTITDNSTSTSISIPTKNTGYAYVICAENEAGALCSENTYARIYAFNQSNPYDEINENKSFQYRTHPNGLGVNDWRGYAEINSLTRDVTHLNGGYAEDASAGSFYNDLTNRSRVEGVSDADHPHSYAKDQRIFFSKVVKGFESNTYYGIANLQLGIANENIGQTYYDLLKFSPDGTTDNGTRIASHSGTYSSGGETYLDYRRSFPMGLDVDFAGNIYVFAEKYGTTYNYQDPNSDQATNYGAVLIKFDKDLNQIWEVEVDVSCKSYDPEIKYSAFYLDPWGNSYLAGKTSSGANYDVTSNFHASCDSAKRQLNDSMDYYVTKIDSDGNFQWVSTETLPNDQGLWGITGDVYGNIFIAGITEGSIDGGTTNTAADNQTDLFIIKLRDSDGNRQGAVQVSSTSTLTVFNGYSAGTLTDLFVDRIGLGQTPYVNPVTVDALGNVYLTGSVVADNASVLSQSIVADDGRAHFKDVASFIVKYDNDLANPSIHVVKGTDNQSAAVQSNLSIDAGGKIYFVSRATMDSTVLDDYPAEIQKLSSSGLNKEGSWSVPRLRYYPDLYQSLINHETGELSLIGGNSAKQSHFMDIDFFGKANSGDPDPLFLTVATSQISTQTVTPPEAPVLTYSDLTVSGQQITVNFSAVTGAESYTIFKENNENGEPTPLDVNTSSTTEQPSSAPPYVHTGLISGKRYDYKIQANDHHYRLRSSLSDQQGRSIP